MVKIGDELPKLSQK